MLVCSFLFSICTRDRGCSAHPVFPAPSLEGCTAPSWGSTAPSIFGGKAFLDQLGRIASRERGSVCCLKSESGERLLTVRQCHRHPEVRANWRASKDTV